LTSETNEPGSILTEALQFCQKKSAATKSQRWWSDIQYDTNASNTQFPQGKDLGIHLFVKSSLFYRNIQNAQKETAKDNSVSWTYIASL